MKMRKEDFFEYPSSPKKMLKTGDRVRFLNSVGGGTVTAFRGKDQVLVEDTDGFEIPVLITECVVVGEADRLMDSTATVSYSPPVKTGLLKKEAPDRQEIEVSKHSNISDWQEINASKQAEVKFIETPQGERLNLSMAFLPVEAKDFMQTPFEAYLINESNYYLYFNYMSCNNNSWTSRFNGLIEPDTKMFLEEFPKSAINELEHLCVQMIAFKKDKTYALKNTLSVELRLDTVKFYKLHCFTKNPFFDEDALVVPLVLYDVPERQMLVSTSDIQAAIHERKKDERRTPQPATHKSKPADNRIEIDLHINQLVETTSGMNNANLNISVCN